MFLLVLFVPKSRLNWFTIRHGTTLWAVWGSAPYQVYTVDSGVNEVPPPPLTGWRVSHATFTLKSVYMFRAHPCLSVRWWESLGGREGQLTVTVWNGEWQQGNGSLNFWLVLSFPHQLRSGSVPFDSNSRMAGRVREGEEGMWKERKGE